MTRSTPAEDLQASDGATPALSPNTLHPVAPAPAPARCLRWSEDWVAAFLGLAVIGLVLAGLRPEVPKFRWSTDRAAAERAAAKREAVVALGAAAAAAGEPALAGKASGLATAIRGGDRLSIGKAATALGAAAKDARTAALAKKAKALSKELGDSGTSFSGLFAQKNLASAGLIGLAYLLLTAVGVALLGGKVLRYAVGFPVVYGLAWISQVLAGNATVSYWGLEYVIFALAIGLFIGNVLGVPGWLREAVRTEYFIKAGLVILGASILFQEIVQAGVLGIAQAVLVVSAVWGFSFWLTRKLKVDDELAVMLSTAVSICGVSAAIAACGAIQGDKRKLSYVTSLVLIVAVPMMVAMPWIVRTLGIPEVVGGAWLGGTLDTSGSVVAAGSLISDAAMKAGVVVKFSQNVLLGVAAFALTLWWTLRRGRTAAARPSASVIWERFPKFVLGFLVASIAFSFVLGPETVAATKGTLGALRTTFFALAFVSIGLETRLGDLVSMDRGRPALAFVGAQAFNVLWTLALAFLLFGGLLVAVPHFE